MLCYVMRSYVMRSYVLCCFLWTKGSSAIPKTSVVTDSINWLQQVAPCHGFHCSTVLLCEEMTDHV